MTTFGNDQSFEQVQHNLSDIIDKVRESRGRKEERHPGKFDERLAVLDTYRNFGKMPQRQAIAVLAAALHRLAVMEDYNPVVVKFPEIADLDFAYDPKDDPKGE